MTAGVASECPSVALAVGRVPAWSRVVPQAWQRSGGAVYTFPQKQAMVQLMVAPIVGGRGREGWRCPLGSMVWGVRRSSASFREVEGSNPHSKSGFEPRR
jgi:hypothetical protein